MNTIELNLDDYLSEERKAEIAEETFRSSLEQKLRQVRGVDRILSNISYYAVFDVIDSEVENGGEKITELIREQAFKFINQGRNYGIFRPGSPWELASSATKIVEDLVHEKRDLIRDRATQAIREMPFDKIKNEIKYVLHERIDNILAGIEEENNV